MDINPNYHQQLLMETLSQGSGGSQSHRSRATGGGGGGGGSCAAANPNSRGNRGEGGQQQQQQRGGDGSVAMQSQQSSLAQSSRAGGGGGGGGYGRGYNNNPAQHHYQHQHHQQNPVLLNNSYNSNHQFQPHNNNNNSRSLASVGGGGGASQASSHVDEAYRRLGHRLSLQAHGDDLSTTAASTVPPPLQRIRVHPSSGFVPYDPNNQQQQRRQRRPSNTNPDTAAAFNGVQQPLDDRMSTDGSSFYGGGGAGGGAPLDDRIMKVRKTNYADHGEHGFPSNEQQQRMSAEAPLSNSLLKSLTYRAKDLFRKWQDAEPPHPSKSGGSGSVSNKATPTGAPASDEQQQQLPDVSEPSSDHYAAFSQLDLEGNQKLAAASSASGRAPPVPSSAEEDDYPDELVPPASSSSWTQRQQHGPQHLNQHNLHHHNHRHHRGMMGPPSSSASKGLLSSVMEGHSDSADHSVRTSPSISTKDSCTARSSLAKDNATGTAAAAAKQQQRQPSPTLQRHPAVRGKCLTAPSEGVTNDGWDNAEGNLIVHGDDVIVVPAKSLHTVSSQNSSLSIERPVGGGAGRSGGLSDEFRVLSLLGQGTFAQVFKCLHVPSGKEVAVKVVKNKPAYTRQAAVEIDVFRVLQEGNGGEASKNNGRAATPTTQASTTGAAASSRDYMVNLVCFFMHRSHLCLVFELLGLNLYEVLKKRQFRGLPLSVVQSIILQAVVAVKDLSQKNIVHCDLKPENVLLESDTVLQDILSAGESKRPSNSGEKSKLEACDSANSESTGAGTVQTANTAETRKTSPADAAVQRGKIKIIDFGSACFEGYTAHTYIQSRFYRSPEVLIGLPYDSAIDMWSLGCVAAELFLGLPILPGVHEHDQLGRISEMVGKVPDWMLEQGSKSTKYYLKYVTRPPTATGSASPTTPSPMISTPSPAINQGSPSPGLPHPLPQWRLKTLKEYIVSLSQNEIRKKGGLTKLEKQPGNRYFKRKRLADILTLHAQSTSAEDKELLPAFVHFLYGLLDLDPWKRWTAFQALQHPFLTGDLSQLDTKTPDMKLDPKEENQANLELGLFWPSPWDPAVCRRKLLNVQKLREKQQAMRRNTASRPHVQGSSLGEVYLSADRLRPHQSDRISNQAGMQLQVGTPMDESPGPNRFQPRGGFSPPKEVTGSPSTAASNQASTPLPLRSTSGHGSWGRGLGTASSLTGLGLPGARVPLACGNDVALQLPPSVSGVPKSFTGTGLVGAGRTLDNDGDFANALQRPGVVPSIGTTAPDSPGGPWSNNVQNTVPTQQRYTDDVIQRRDIAESQYKISNGMPQSGGTPSTQPLSQPTSRGTSFATQNNPASFGTQAFGQPFQPMPPPNGNLGGMPSSASSSLTMGDVNVPMRNPLTGFAYADNPQVSFQQQQQYMTQQQQQQQIGMQAPTQFQFAPDQSVLQAQQPQQLQLQQQPVYLAGNAGGGYYYVTTSAMGQPMVLQPVAFMNQQSNQFGQQQVNPDVPIQQALPPPQYQGQQNFAQVYPTNANGYPGQFGQQQQQQQQQQQPFQQQQLLQLQHLQQQQQQQQQQQPRPQQGRPQQSPTMRSRSNAGQYGTSM